jgi:phosphocarrier protein
LFVQTASRFDCDLKARHDDKEANAKSILSVLTLGANEGAEVTIYAEGDDAEEALEALEALIANNFGE